MKITHICIGNFYPDGYSYQENMLPKFHKKMGYEVSVIAGLDVFDENGKTTYLQTGKEYVGDYGISVFRLNFVGNKRLSKKFKNYEGLYDKLCLLQPDIIFIHNCQFICINQVVKYIKKHKNVRCYVDNHADFSNSATNWVSLHILHRIIWKHCAQMIDPYTKKFYGVLPARVDFLKNVYDLPKEKCELLVMGADDELVTAASKPEIKREIREQYGIQENDFLVMTGGKIDLYKQQTLFLMQAVKNIRNENVKLIVFGSVVPELKEKVEALADGHKIIYAGWIKSEKSYEYFAAADLVVFPGRHSVFWEQVTGQGKPMIVKDWEGTKHVDIGGNVRFLTNDSVEEIQTAIQDLIDHPETYQKMKSIAEQKGMKVFSYKEIARRSIL